MIQVVKLTRLVLCKKCGWHGSLVFPDGSTSEMFATKEKALAEVEAALSFGKIAEPEAVYLVEEILGSSLFLEKEIGVLKPLLVRMMEESEHSLPSPDFFPSPFYDLNEKLSSRKRTLH